MRNHTPHSASRATPCAAMLALVLCLFAFLGCARQPAPEAPPASYKIWTLTPDAEATYLFLLYEDARRNDRQEEAIAILDELLELAPTPRIYSDAATYYWSLDLSDDARELLKEGMKLFPENRELPMALATTYFAEKRYDAAALTLTEYLTINPEDWQAYQELTVVRIEAGEHALALDALEKVPEAHRTPAMLYYWAKASAALGLNHQAIQKLHQAVADNPSFIEAWAELAFQFEIVKDYVQAEQTYARILELGERGNEVWLRLINLNLKLNNPDKALDIYREGPDDVDFSLEAATLFLDENFFEQARAILEPQIEADGAQPRIWFYLALLAYEGDQDPDAALEYLERIKPEDQHYDRAARFRIHLLIEQGQHDTALELIRREQAASPDFSEYWQLEARLFERKGEYDRARQTLEKALKRWPEDTSLLYSLGIVLDRLEMRDKSVEVMERIIGLNPEHSDALNYVGYTLADEGLDLPRALLLIKKALALKPGSGYIIDSLAWAHFRNGDAAKAWETINQAVEHVADDPIIWEHYGDIAKALGKTNKAREGYRNSLELKPDNPDVREKLEKL